MGEPLPIPTHADERVARQGVLLGMPIETLNGLMHSC
jgi:hypothetical protein